ncbi:transposase [Carboxylicivirga sp. N1Y90]|uniref:transposase n=1 Tax=Carboxylicivirga fragile TaxID=3417571 RepID=UPI003D345C97|nr:transposase [Marinilabiliaceae bacterium N1Y90]
MQKLPKEIILSAESVVVVADRAYVDFENLYRWHKGNSYFVVRLKKSVKFKRLNKRELPESRHQHILVDEYIELEDAKTYSKYQ